MMASSQVEIAASSPFGCSAVHNRRDPCFKNNINNLVIANDNSRHVDFTDLWVHHPQWQTTTTTDANNTIPTESNAATDAGSNNNNKSNDIDLNREINVDSPSRKDNWARARQMVFPNCRRSGKGSSAPSSPRPSGISVEVPHSGGVSSLVQKWRGFEAEAKCCSCKGNPAAMSSQDNAGPECPAAATNEDDSLSDWESDKTGPSGPPSSLGRHSDATERERLRVADIIRKLTEDRWNDAGSSESQLRIRTPPEPDLRCVPMSPRIRGRQAYIDLLMQMERDRRNELDRLVRRKAVSKFPHRGRIQALLRIAFLRRGLEAKEVLHSDSTSSEPYKAIQSAILQFRERVNNQRAQNGSCRKELTNNGPALEAPNLCAANQQGKENQCQEINSYQSAQNGSCRTEPTNNGPAPGAPNSCAANEQGKENQCQDISSCRKEPTNYGPAPGAPNSCAANQKGKENQCQDISSNQSAQNGSCRKEPTNNSCAPGAPNLCAASQQGKDKPCQEITSLKTSLTIKTQNSEGSRTSKEHDGDHSSQKVNKNTHQNVHILPSSEYLHHDEASKLPTLTRQETNFENSNHSLAKSAETVTTILNIEITPAEKTKPPDKNIQINVENKEEDSSTHKVTKTISNKNIQVNAENKEEDSSTHKVTKSTCDKNIQVNAENKEEDSSTHKVTKSICNKNIQVNAENKEEDSSIHQVTETICDKTIQVNVENKEEDSSIHQVTETNTDLTSDNAHPADDQDLLGSDAYWVSDVSHPDAGWEELHSDYQQQEGSNRDWIDEVSRPRSDWEGLRQARYQEMLDPFLDNEEIRVLLGRKSVSSFLSSGMRQKIDRLMISRTQGQQKQTPKNYQKQEEIHKPLPKLEQAVVSEADDEQNEGEDYGDYVDEYEEADSSVGQQYNVCDDNTDQITFSPEPSWHQNQGHESIDHSYQVPSPSKQQSQENGTKTGDYTNHITSSPAAPWLQNQGHALRDCSYQLPLPSPFTQPSLSNYSSRDNGTSSGAHPVLEMELMYDLKGHMEKLHQEMSELRKSIKCCMDMQIELQRSIKKEVAIALRNSDARNSRRNSGRRCHVCRKMQVDSLLYRCGHMCMCFKCAHELQWSSGKCPICRAPIVDIVRAYTNCS